MKSDAGFRYVLGYLCSIGIRVQKQCILSALQCVDCIGRLIRKRAVIRRRRYFSSRPNALWHCDGHHKLIKYGFVIHGFIDRNCRTVCRATPFSSTCLILDRSRPFVPAPIILPALFLNSSYWPQPRMAHHIRFVVTEAEKMSWFLHI